MKHSLIGRIFMLILMLGSKNTVHALAPAQKEGKAWFKKPFPKIALVDRVIKRAEEKKGTKPITRLTMDEATQMAYHYKPNLLAFKYLVQASSIKEREAWSGYYPALNFVSNISANSGTRFPHASSTFGASQLIYSAAGPQTLHKLAVHNTEALKLQEEALRNDTRLAVELAFLDAWVQQQQRQAINTLYATSKEVFKQAAHQEKLNLLDKNDWLKQVEAYTNNLSTIGVYEDGSSSAQKRLEFLTGYSFNLNIKPETAATTKPVTSLHWNSTKEIPRLHPLDYYQHLAITHRPEIKEKQQLIEIQQVNVNLARYTRLPVFNLDASTTYDNTGEAGPFNNNKTSNSMSLSVTVPIFDQMLSDYRGNEAQAAKLAAMLNKQATMQQVKSDVEIAYYALAQELTRFKAEKYRLDRATNEFELQKLQLKVGTISKVEFETAQLNWSNAQFAWLNLRINVEKQLQQLMHDCGYPERTTFLAA